MTSFFRAIESELTAVVWMLVAVLPVAWWFDLWTVSGWVVAFLLSLRWLVALGVSGAWLASGGRKLSHLWAGPLSSMLYQSTKLLEKERRLSQKLLGRARYFKYAAKALPEGVMALDKAKRIAWFNQGAMSLLGLRRSHRKQAIEGVLRLPEVIDLIEGKTTQPVKIPSPVHPLKTLEVDIRSFMLGHDLLIVRDITAFKRNDEIRRDFVANASHELRTPLTVMHGYVETMLDTPGCHHEQWQKPLEQMYNQTERMRKIIEDMLTLSRLESGEENLQAKYVDVPGLLMQLLDEAKQYSGKHEHVISLDLATQSGIVGYENYLSSAFTNLVTNAIRYTPDHGQISIRWWEDAEGHHLSVCDTGIGISEEHLPRIMERFYRVDSARSRETGGTGLGLAITRHVLDRHDASLTVESVLGKGSCFGCHFPAV